jgi:hypothetical protein
MVQQHLRSAHALAAGIAALPDTRTSAAYTQAAWRFLNNERVLLPQLAQPMLIAAEQLLEEHGQNYGLVMHDWSRLNFGGHASKRDRRKMTHKTDIGYELQSSVLVSDEGKPLAPLVHNLVNARRTYTTLHDKPRACQRHLDELTRRIQWIDARGWCRPLVHIVDREADSVAHWRAWSAQASRFLVRTKNSSQVCFQGQAIKPKDLAEQISYRPVGEVRYHGRAAYQSIAQAHVLVTRKAKPAHKVSGKRASPVAGAPLAMRLVVSRIHDARGKLLAQWLLLSNMPDEVDAATLARWYYYRWQIESMFKLLKSAGQQVEDWLQDDALAIAKRLVVASCACVLVWQLAAATSPQARDTQQFLVRLSGRQMNRRRPVTAPALFAGLWILLSTLTVLEHYDINQLKQFAKLVFPNRYGP